MKTMIVMTLVLASVTGASAQYLGSTGNSGLSGTGSNPNSHYVSPHTNSNGTYVPGHHATNPNNTQLDNFGTRGNVNPYTGSIGTRGARY
jgi:hypothetical protein